MGYEVDVKGEITFNDIEGFRVAFEKIAQRRTCEVGDHGDYDYFFTKMWGDNLENLKVIDGIKMNIKREGKLWYDADDAMDLLSRFAKGEVKFHGEDGYQWAYILDGKGGVERLKLKAAFDM